eukprot:scaffold3540_cov379-Prasinococcus_capsulatus_cf.AAC.20
MNGDRVLPSGNIDYWGRSGKQQLIADEVFNSKGGTHHNQLQRSHAIRIPSSVLLSQRHDAT